MNIQVKVEELISIYCDLHNLLVKSNPTWFESAILGTEAKDMINRQLMFTKSKLIKQIESGMKRKTQLPAEQNIYKADYEEIIKKILGENK